jgi:hypothetical protein
MDCCCLNRPTDDQTNYKIRIETDAIIGILFKCLYGQWKLIGSDIIEYEINKIPDLNKRNKVLNLYSLNKGNIELNDKIKSRALEVQKYGLKPLDSLHFASAEYKNANVLLTVDKDFLKNSQKANSYLSVENPVNWFMEVIENE